MVLMFLYQQIEKAEKFILKNLLVLEIHQFNLSLQINLFRSQNLIYNLFALQLKLMCNNPLIGKLKKILELMLVLH